MEFFACCMVLNIDFIILAKSKGIKTVKLFSPEKFLALYPNPLGSPGRTIQSQVDLDSPNYDEFPLFSTATCDEGTLYSGDILFIPSFYWHQG